MVKCSIEYKGDLRCELLHEPSGSHALTDAPVDNCGKGESFSPTDFLCSSLAACMATIMGIYANNHQLDLTGMKIELVKHMQASPRRVAKIEMMITMPIPVNSPHCASLVEAALSCPVKQSLHPEIELPITWIWL